MSSTPAAEGVEALRFDLLNPALWDDKGALPVIAAIEHDQHLAGLDMAESVGLVARPCA